MDNSEKLITIKQAYQAMLLFLEVEYKLTQSDDLGELLGGFQLTDDGETMDPAAWGDWIAAVNKISDEEKNGSKASLDI